MISNDEAMKFGAAARVNHVAMHEYGTGKCCEKKNMVHRTRARRLCAQDPVYARVPCTCLNVYCLKQVMTHAKIMEEGENGVRM